MTATAHAVIGAVIAAKVSDPLIGIPLALASHVIADLIPHWDAGTHYKKKTGKQLFTEAAADVTVGYFVAYAVLFLFFPQTNLLYAFIMIFASQFFDYLPTPYYMFGIKNKFFKSLFDLSDQLNSRLDRPWGIVTQVVTITLLILLAKLF